MSECACVSVYLFLSYVSAHLAPLLFVYVCKLYYTHKCSTWFLHAEFAERNGVVLMRATDDQAEGEYAYACVA